MSSPLGRRRRRGGGCKSVINSLKNPLPRLPRPLLLHTPCYASYPPLKAKDKPSLHFFFTANFLGDLVAVRTAKSPVLVSILHDRQRGQRKKKQLSGKELCLICGTWKMGNRNRDPNVTPFFREGASVVHDKKLTFQATFDV